MSRRMVYATFAEKNNPNYSHTTARAAFTAYATVKQYTIYWPTPSSTARAALGPMPLSRRGLPKYYLLSAKIANDGTTKVIMDSSGLEYGAVRVYYLTALRFQKVERWSKSAAPSPG